MDSERIRVIANRVTAKRLGDVINLTFFLSTLSLVIGLALWQQGFDGQLFVGGFLASSTLQVVLLIVIRKALSWEVGEYHREPPESKVDL